MVGYLLVSMSITEGLMKREHQKQAERKQHE